MVIRKIQSLEMLEVEPPIGGELLERWGVNGLHVGCSEWSLEPGWLNSDIATIEGPDGASTSEGRVARVNGELYYLQQDATQPFPLQAGVFQWVYSEHFIEHVTQEQTIAFLKEAWRVLKPGGTIRLTTPSLTRYVDGYMDPDGRFFREHEQKLRAMVRFLQPEQLEREAAPLQIASRRGWMLNQIFQHWGHRWIYDFDELAYVLESAGFDRSEISECSFRHGQARRLFEMDSALRADESIYVEARKS